MNTLEARNLVNQTLLKHQNIDLVSKIPHRYPFRKIKRDGSNLKSKKQLYNSSNHRFQEKSNIIGLNKILGYDGYVSYYGSLPIRTPAKSVCKQLVKPSSQHMENYEYRDYIPREKNTEHFLVNNKFKNPLSSSQHLLSKKKCNCGQCTDCTKNFNEYLKMFLDDESLPFISAKSWCIWKKQKGRYNYVYGKRPYKQRQIASITKILVSIIVYQKLKKWNFNPSQIYYEIPNYISETRGTSANLKPGQLINITDLLFGLMLPSGNDAAVILSELIGLLISLDNRKKLRSFDVYNFQSFLPYNQKSYSYFFVNSMNQKCKQLGLINTYFYNPHGNDAFDQYKNTSNSHQIGKICFDFLQNDFLINIANTKFYKQWTNTNKLLWEGFQGIKTGITETAGPCLVALYQDILIVVLNSKSMQQRWIQVKKLVKWVKMKR